MPTLLDVIYAAGLVVGSPYFLFRIATSARYRKGLRQRFPMLHRDVLETARDRRPVWIHAASVGELNAARTFIEEVEKRFPERGWVISTFTSTGYELACQRYGRGRVFYFPLDFTCIASRLVKRLKPACLVLVELELWPNVLRLLHRRGIPVLVVNGRIREKSVRRLRRARFMLGPVGRQVPHLCCVQNEEYAERFRRLGLKHDCIRVTGTMKYDTVVDSVDEAARDRTRQELGLEIGAPVVVAGSTWPGEEEKILDAYARLRKEWPNLRLLIAPRHIERSNEVENLIRARGFDCLRRSSVAHPPSGVKSSQRGAAVPHGHVDFAAKSGQNTVMLLDTMGELVRSYSLATAAFVGRSLVPGGGQNMLEPAALGVPVVFGPHTDNFRSEAQMLVAAGAAEVVADGEALFAALGRLLADEARRSRMAQAARRVVSEKRGATARNIQAVAQLLGRAN